MELENYPYTSVDINSWLLESSLDYFCLKFIRYLRKLCNRKMNSASRRNIQYHMHKNTIDINRFCEIFILTKFYFIKLSWEFLLSKTRFSVHIFLTTSPNKYKRRSHSNLPKTFLWISASMFQIHQSHKPRLNCMHVFS